ncbi:MULTISPECIES: RrF2 family transcriptional regulator [Janthinobacterium]|uniref:Rrf2 family transcriptional regulator n=1 Tax=Janthinobacterium lividum TaxID=29581 RepID=A0AAJ4T7P0_9BURK|nr:MULTISPECIES: Rrf2 family transcriptional regulator [Janthinobacterium]KAB0324714.1 Rrf2 family transcriptional regulator [Janthinobacterium lividum]MCC7712876.1 Rrf2 family transcriptional regulator [Janthinobacterium lividum]OEZ50239.1 HTH-type transcriptional regulator CymR [Janthinobacterium sp. MP5059B]OEZ55791.1 HTH-type transcriptional regulator CymR [Janthinobacterium lividum]PHV50400.1 Rrf2 family transcriptional regulator [Janthinobacterium sp. BJB301]
MAHYGSGTEYGLHCLLYLAQPLAEPASSRDLAELQGISVSFLAKIFPKLEKAGIVTASEGIRGGYQLARPPGDISVLDVVDAIEGPKPLFDCQQIRSRCTLYEGEPPGWMTSGVCGIHALMLRAEKSMRAELGKTTLLDLAQGFGSVAPAGFGADVQGWFSGRVQERSEARIAAVRGPKSRRIKDDVV